MSPLAPLFALTEAFAAASGISESTVSERVLKGGNRIRDLRKGSTDIGVRRLATAIQWFSDNWPENASWPEGVTRPSQTETTA